MNEKTTLIDRATERQLEINRFTETAVNFMDRMGVHHMAFTLKGAKCILEMDARPKLDIKKLASVMSQRIVEIVDPSGRVSCRRPEGHKDVKEARDGIKSGNLGYSLRYADNGEDAL